MLLALLRCLFVGLLVGISLWAYAVLQAVGWSAVGAIGGALAVLTFGSLVFLTDVREKEKQITTISALYFGLLLGMLLGWLFSLALEPVVLAIFETDDSVRKVMSLGRLGLTVVCCYVTISTLLQTKDEFRFIIPYVEFSKQIKGGRPLVLDTSVIIDGRIADVCDTRLVDTRLIVPRFVLDELKGIADSTDKTKRSRGRRGMDILKRLQTNTKIDLQMHDGNVAELRGNEKIRVD
ncbi:MAG: PIN/TRAM domain-containing protein, partial [Gemmataceae bacterium]